MEPVHVPDAGGSGNADADLIMNRVLTEGIREAAKGMDFGEARVADGFSGAVVPSGMVWPVRSGAFTPEEREEIIRGLENCQG